MRAWQHRWYLESWLQGFICFGIHIPRICGNIGPDAGNRSDGYYVGEWKSGNRVAVMGAFSLVRFRSAPGTAKEISSIFLAMAVGLATGMGYIGIAALFVIIMGIVNIIFTVSKFGENPANLKALRITIPESLDYTNVFDEIFAQYLKRWELIQAKTTNMGSLFKLEYQIVLKKAEDEKKLIDDLRCRNGNLEILCSRAATGREEL